MDDEFIYEYDQIDPAVPSPATAGCSPWTFKCRIIINYEQHIHPLWALLRAVDLDGDTVEDDATCTTCHAPTNDAMEDMVPAAQLDLTDGISDLEDQHLKSYQELFSTDLIQVLDEDGNLDNRKVLVPVDADGDGVTDVDDDGNEIFVEVDDVTATVAASMSGNGARASYFIEKMTETELNAGRTLTPTSDPDYVDHSGMLSVHELKLISEWLDVGAQYFNNPFDEAVPMN